MNKIECQNKLQEIKNDGIQNGIYKLAEDNKHFRSFLYRNFKEYEYYDKMWPESNQPAQLCGTAKTHEFNNIDDITINNLKFRPITAQSGTCTYNAAQVIAQCLKPLCKSLDWFLYKKDIDS